MGVQYNELSEINRSQPCSHLSKVSQDIEVSQDIQVSQKNCGAEIPIKWRQDIQVSQDNLLIFMQLQHKNFNFNLNLKMKMNRTIYHWEKLLIVSTKIYMNKI
jgi:hypothetical protein